MVKKKIYIVSKSKNSKIISAYECKNDALNFITNSLDKSLILDEIDYFEKKRTNFDIRKIPNEILQDIFEYIEQDKYINIMLVCKRFYHLIISIKLKNINLFALSMAYDNRLNIKKKDNIIVINGKTYNYRNIFKKYNGIWKPSDKEWVFIQYNILFFLEKELKNNNIYGLYNSLSIYKINYNNYLINVMENFKFKNLYEYYLHIKKRYKYNTNCKYCFNNKTCDLCINSCCDKMRYPENNSENYSFIYICFKHGNVKYKYQGD